MLFLWGKKKDGRKGGLRDISYFESVRGVEDQFMVVHEGAVRTGFYHLQPPSPKNRDSHLSAFPLDLSPSNKHTHTNVCASSPPEKKKLPSAFSPLIQSVCVIGPLTHSASVPPARGLLSIFILPSWHENATTLRLVLDHWRFTDECVSVCECESTIWDARASSFP